MNEAERIAAMQAAASSINTGINAFAQSNLNKKTMKWNEQQMQTQRQWALQDWQMQNEYNSPTAQMKRLQEAGLNPNLIYGRGTGDLTAQPIRSTDSKSWNPTPPRFELDSILAQYQNTKMQNIQMDSLKKQQEIQNANLANIAAQTLKTLADVDMSKFDLKQKQTLAQNQVIVQELIRQGLEQDVQKNTIEINDKQLAYDIRKSLQGNTLLQAAEDLLSKRMSNSKTSEERAILKQQLDNLKLDNQTKEYDLKLFQQRGYNRNDPALQRILIDAMNDPTNFSNIIKAAVGSIFNKGLPNVNVRKYQKQYQDNKKNIIINKNQ